MSLCRIFVRSTGSGMRSHFQILSQVEEIWRLFDVLTFAVGCRGMEGRSFDGF
jgi:hypothetical protein